MIRVRLLGEFGVTKDGLQIEPPIGLARDALVLLSIQACSPVSGQVLMDRLRLDDDAGRRRLAQALDRVQGMLGSDADLLTRSGDGATQTLQLPTDGSDLLQSRRLARLARAEVDDCARAADLWAEAAAPWRGPVLRDIPASARWPEQRALAAEQESMRRNAAAARIAAGRIEDGLVDELWASAVERPDREYWPALLMDALVARGRLAEAASVYRHAAARINELGGIDPGPELVRRRDRIDELQQRRQPTVGTCEVAVLVVTRFADGVEDDAGLIRCIRSAGGVVVWRREHALMAVFDGDRPHEQAFACSLRLRDLPCATPGRSPRRTVAVSSGASERFVRTAVTEPGAAGLVLSGRALADVRQHFLAAPQGSIVLDDRTRDLLRCAHSCGDSLELAAGGHVLIEPGESKEQQEQPAAVAPAAPAPVSAAGAGAAAPTGRDGVRPARIRPVLRDLGVARRGAARWTGGERVLRPAHRDLGRVLALVGGEGDAAGGDELPVYPVLLEQLLVRPLLYDVSAVEDDDAVRILHRRQAVGDDDGRDAGRAQPRGHRGLGQVV